MELHIYSGMEKNEWERRGEVECVWMCVWARENWTENNLDNIRQWKMPEYQTTSEKKTPNELSMSSKCDW